MTGVLKPTETQRLKAALRVQDDQIVGLRSIIITMGKEADRLRAALTAIQTYVDMAEGEPTTEAIKQLVKEGLGE